VAKIHTNSYENISEKNRFEKLTNLFLKLRVYLNENPENELIIVKEFFIRHGLYNQDFFTFENISNFINFINSENCLKFHPSRSLKDIIFDVFKIDYEEYHEHDNLYRENMNDYNNNFKEEIYNNKNTNNNYFNIINKNNENLNENKKRKRISKFKS